jgi:hypothetical protein
MLQVEQLCMLHVARRMLQVEQLCMLTSIANLVGALDKYSKDRMVRKHRHINRIDDTDNRMDGTDNRMDGTDNRMDGTDNRIDGTDNRMDGTDIIALALPITV